MNFLKRHKRPHPSADDSRRGVALLIVIGLLAVLLIMGVAFSVYMRIERAGASNFRHGTEARHMLQAALARAAEVINDSATNHYPIFNPTAAQVPAGAPFRDHVMVSEGIDISAQVLSQEALKYVPEDLRRAVRTATPQWQAIFDNNNNAIGRCAFIIVNNSGLLDANHVGGAPRDMGTSPAEIQLDPELLGDVQNPASFTATRTDTHGGYHTMTELRNLAAGFEEDNYFNPPANRNFNFETYSRFLDRVPTNDVVEKVLLRWDEDAESIENPEDVRQALSDAGVAEGTAMPGVYRDFTLMALNNYMSPGVVPPPMLDILREEPEFTENVQGPNTKPVPMTCEIIMVHLPDEYWTSEPVDAENPDSNDRITVRFMYWIKFMYPVQHLSGNYEASVYLYFAPDPACNIPMPETGGQGGIGDSTVYDQTFDITLASPSGEISPYPMGPDPNSPTVLEVTFEVPDADAWTPVLKYRVIPRVEVRLNGEAVDRVPGFDWRNDSLAPNPQQNELDLMLEVDSDDPAKMQPLVSCLDARFNWHTLPSFNPFWKYYDNEFIYEGLPSLYTQEFFNDPMQFMLEDALQYWPDFVEDDDAFDKHRIVCSDPDQSGLRSVGELGLIPIAPWMTIPIFDREIPGYNIPYDRRERARIFQHFTLDEEETRDPVAGLVNINTAHTNVLASVFMNMPLYEWEDADETRLPLTLDQARALAGLIIRHGPYTDAAGIGRIPRSEIVDSLDADPDNPGESSKFAVEALLRNAYYLLGWRQQFFTVIMRADAFAPSFGFTGIERGSVLSTGIAIAQIWRDPIPNADGRHPMFVRYFKPLNE